MCKKYVNNGLENSGNELADIKMKIDKINNLKKLLS